MRRYGMVRSICAFTSLQAALLWGFVLSGCTQPAPPSLGTRLDGSSASTRGAITRTNKEIGTRHPVMLQNVSPDGRWLVYCQARADTNGDGAISVWQGRHGQLYGDQAEPYLVLGDGPERPIDDFVASDDAGNHLVVVISGRMILIDTRTGRETDLSQQGANPMDVNYAIGSHRAASFDQRGQRLLYLRKSTRGDIPVVRDLTTDHEIELDPGDGQVWRAELDSEGQWVTLKMVVKDTDGDGKLTLPGLVTNLASRRCRGLVGSYGVRGIVGDEPIVRVVPATGGQAREVADLVRPWGERLLKRTTEGALVLESASGQSQELVPASCKGTVLHADVARGQILVECNSSQPESHMALYGQGLHVDFTEDRPSPWDDIVKNTVLRLYRSRHGLIDLERRSAYHLEGTSLYARYQGRALLGRENRLVLYDADTRAEALVAASDYSSGLIDQSGSMVLLSTWSADPARAPGPAVNKAADHTGQEIISPSGEKKFMYRKLLVFDLATGQFVGQLSPTGLAVTNDGYVLKPKWPSYNRTANDGPLQWIRPTPLP